VIGQPSGCCDNDMWSLSQGKRLRPHITAASDENDFERLWCAKSQKLLVDLECQFTCRRENYGVDAKWVLGPFLQNRNRKSDGFTCTSLRAADAVPSSENLGNARALNLRRVGDSHRAKGMDEPWRHLQRFEACLSDGSDTFAQYRWQVYFWGLFCLSGWSLSDS
jgi:hypothetical protein